VPRRARVLHPVRILRYHRLHPQHPALSYRSSQSLPVYADLSLSLSHRLSRGHARTRTRTQDHEPQPISGPQAQPFLNEFRRRSSVPLFDQLPTQAGPPPHAQRMRVRRTHPLRLLQPFLQNVALARVVKWGYSGIAN
jgi:hypothetical protein